jgi:hypothetical protein
MVAIPLPAWLASTRTGVALCASFNGIHRRRAVSAKAHTQHHSYCATQVYEGKEKQYAELLQKALAAEETVSNETTGEGAWLVGLVQTDCRLPMLFRARCAHCMSVIRCWMPGLRPPPPFCTVHSQVHQCQGSRYRCWHRYARWSA